MTDLVKDILGKPPDDGETLIGEALGKMEEGCDYGKSNRTMLGWLATLLALVMAILVIVANLNASNTSDSIRNLNQQVKDHSAAINSASVQSGRIEERLDGVQKSLGRIEKMLEKNP